MTAGPPIIAPSLLSADFGALADAARAVHEAGAEYLHFDVMDGRFVPNITMGPNVVRALRPVSPAFFDVHLMIVEPERLVEEFARAGADGITVHAEACVHLQRTLAQIRECGCKAGVALNPSTPPDALEYVVGDVDLVLLMTVNPGFGGQSFLPAVVPKIRAVRAMLCDAGRDARLEVDGGIAPDTAAAVTKAGADVLVAGTAVFGDPSGPAAGIQNLRRAAA